MRKRWKRIAVLAMTLALAVSTIAGCGGKKESSGGGAGSGKGKKDSITIGMKGEPNTLDPQMHSNIDTQNMMACIYEPVIRHDYEHDELLPGIADEWKVSDDQLTVDFTLRTDYKFHNGDPITIDDVIYTLERAKASSFQNIFYEAVDTFERVDDTHLRLHLNKPDKNLLYNISDYSMVVPKKEIEKDPEGFARNPVGSGPYKFVSWSQNIQIDLVANEDYPREQPKVKNLTYRFIGDRNTAMVALETGEIDAFQSLSGADFEQVRKNSELELKTMPGNVIYYMGLNVDDEILSNPKVREAICYAMDKQAVIDGAEYGESVIADRGFLLEGEVGYTEDFTTKTRDVEKAKQLLAEAGYADGLKLELKCQSNKITHAQIVQASLKDIGIDVEIVQLEAGAFFEEMEKGNTQLFLSGFGQYTPDPSSTFRYVYRSDGFATGNYYHLVNDRVDELLAQGELSNDPDERQAIYEEVQQIVEDENVVSYIYWVTGNIAHNVKLQNVEPSPGGIFYPLNWDWAE